MVELAEVLMDILKDRKDTLSGEDIKFLVESMILANGVAVVTDNEAAEVKKKQEAFSKAYNVYAFGGE